MKTETKVWILLVIMFLLLCAIQGITKAVVLIGVNLLITIVILAIYLFFKPK